MLTAPLATLWLACGGSLTKGVPMSTTTDLPIGTSSGSSSAARSASRIDGIRRSSMSAFVLLLIQYTIGMGVNLFVKVPSTDRSIGDALSKGPAALTLHVLVGLLLVLASVGLVVKSLAAGRPGLIATSSVGLMAIVGAAMSGSAFLNKGQNSASMSMAVCAGIGLWAFAANLYQLSAPR
jgi:hypothetical protein